MPDCSRQRLQSRTWMEPEQTSASSVPTRNSTNRWCLPRLLLPPPMAVSEERSARNLCFQVQSAAHTLGAPTVCSLPQQVFLIVFLVSTRWLCLHPLLISGFWALTPTFLLGEQTLPKASERQSKWQRAVSCRHTCHTWHTQPELATHHWCHWAGLAECRHILSWLTNTRRSLQLVSLKDFSLNDSWKLRGTNVFCKQAGRNWQDRCAKTDSHHSFWVPGLPAQNRNSDLAGIQSQSLQFFILLQRTGRLNNWQELLALLALVSTSISSSPFLLSKTYWIYKKIKISVWIQCFAVRIPKHQLTRSYKLLTLEPWQPLPLY